MGEVLVKVASFVVIICAGYFAGHTGRLGKGTDTTISKIVFNFTLPCAVVHAFGSAEFTHDMLWLILIGAAFTVGSFFVFLPFVRRASQQDKIFYLCNISGYNIGCFALPFVQAFFPPAQAVATCLFDAGNAVMMAGGSYALTGVFAGGEKVEHPWRLIGHRLFSSVTFDAYIVLVALALAGLKVPEGIVMFTAPMANANSFLAMFMLGLMINLHVDAAKLGKVVRLLAARYAFSVLFTLFALFAPLPFEPAVRIILVMLIWSPAGSMGPVFTLWSKGDYGLAGFANAITVLVGIIAMTTITAILG